MSQEEEYISSKEGEAILGITRQMFFYYVNQGRIRKQPGETPRKTLYNREDVLKLRGETKKADEKPQVVIDWVKTTDLPSTLALDILVYDEPLVGDFNLYYSWLKKNPQITLAAFDAQDRSKVLSYITMLPLPEKVILAVLSGERDEKTITAKDITSFQYEGEYMLLAESAVTLPGHSEYLGSVINAFTSFWCAEWPKRKVRRIYAQAESDEGLFLIQKLFFAPLFDFPDNAYVLDVERKNPSRLVRGFQECIRSKDEAVEERTTTGFVNNSRRSAREATLVDQQAIFALENEIYGGNTVPLDLRIAWYQKNPHIDFVSLRGNEVVGHFSLLPMRYKDIEPMLRGDKKWPTSPDEILPYEENCSYNLFVMSAAVRQDITDHSWYAALAVLEAQKKLADLAEQNIIIETIYATSRTPQGIIFATKLEFDIDKDLSTSKRKVFAMNMQTSQSQWAFRYREQLQKDNL